MNRATYLLLQGLAVVVFVPLSCFLWLERYRGAVNLALLVVLLPIIAHYILAFFGINVFRLWRFTAGPRLGGMPLHIGLSVGGIEAMLAYVCVGLDPQIRLTAMGLGSTALAVASVTAFWNWLFDALAIRVGFMEVRFVGFRSGGSPIAESALYAPAHFGAVGAVYGLAIGLVDPLLFGAGRVDLYWPLAIAATAALILFPSATFVAINYVRFGETGLRPAAAADEDGAIRQK